MSYPGIRDEWIQDYRHCEPIACIMDTGADLNTYLGAPQYREIARNDPRLFAIGTSTVTLSGKCGKLWLGFSDDYETNATHDNYGS
jgi:hypothetical protein